MSLTTLAFLFVYLALAVAGLIRHPIYAVVGYYITYLLAPAARWWGESLANMGLRYSHFMALLALASLLIHLKDLKTNKIISKHEIFLAGLLAIVFVAGWMHPPLAGTENHAIKMAKVFIMLFLLRLSIQDLKGFRFLAWALLLASAYGAFDTRFMAARIGSRIQSGTGGSDLMEGNFLAAHLAVILPFLGVFFLQARWHMKAFLTAAAAIIIDVIIQCRSRGAFLAMAAGAMTAFVFIPSRLRAKLSLLIIFGIAGSVSMMDQNFWTRMTEIHFTTSVEEQDESSAGRILAWRAAISMAADHPLGIGYNNFVYRVEEYAPAIAGKDTHNTYLRCLAELGVQGALLLFLLIVNALNHAYHLVRQDTHPEYALWGYAIGVSLIIYLTAGMFISLTYIEDFYLILTLPAILSRCRSMESPQSTPSTSAYPALSKVI